MNKEQCITKCRFISKHKDKTFCSLYDIGLESALFEDKYDDGFVEGYIKCNDCMEKELSNSIDEKVGEVCDMYNVFVYEMDLLMSELNQMKEKRRKIYE